ncbi:hypothetical protein GN956_G18504 [Arapaima gigas]
MLAAGVKEMGLGAQNLLVLVGIRCVHSPPSGRERALRGTGQWKGTLNPPPTPHGPISHRPVRTVMGSASSRWKKVATRSPHEDPGREGPSTVHSVSVSCRSRFAGGLDRLSEGLDSQSSAEGDVDMDAELDRILAEYQVLESRRSESPGRDEGSDLRWIPLSRKVDGTPQPPRPGGSKPGRARDPERARQPKEKSPQVPRPFGNDLKSFQDQLCTKETALAPGNCDGSLLTMPVIQYDKSEEDLMETIEREFS